MTTRTSPSLHWIAVVSVAATPNSGQGQAWFARSASPVIRVSNPPRITIAPMNQSAQMISKGNCD